MSRRKTAKKRIITHDPVYNSTLVSMIINRILLKGKKALPKKIFYEAMTNIEKFSKKDPLEVLNKAVINATPLLEVRSRRVGGAIYQVPREVKPERGNSLALRLIIKAARERPGRGMVKKLGNELIDAYNYTGSAVKKKEDMHRMAQANKAFSNLRRKKK
uniref:Small ribosomal subunit protein uS7c n=1 Tax=Colacium vesiculosum TaxID=102910 RepID=I6NJI6_9EUGL|nr:ribosomal protein S7 [Colacium vesiculosum]